MKVPNRTNVELELSDYQAGMLKVALYVLGEKYHESLNNIEAEWKNNNYTEEHKNALPHILNNLKELRELSKTVKDLVTSETTNIYIGVE